MKRLFVTGLLCVFMAVVPLFHAVADNNQCRNLFDGEYISVSGGAKAENKNPFYVTPGKKYTISWSASPVAVNLYAYDSNNTLLYSWATSSGSSPYFSDSHNAWYKGATFTVPENVVRLRFNTFSSMTAAQQASWAASLQIEEGDTATEYTPYNPLCATCDGQIENYVSATGTVAQNGTPSPDNPIEPVFYKQGNMVLRKVGDYTDSYDATTGKITRRVGVKVFNGTENWFMSGDHLSGMYNILINDMYAEASSVSSNRASPYSTHFGRSTSWLGYSDTSRLNKVQAYTTTDNSKHILGLGYPGAAESNISAFKQWLAQQYAAGTPVTVYYPLATPVEEDWAAEQCTSSSSSQIKIATTAYNAARFSPVQTDLNNAVATIREIVTKTINQTAAIASLQADKQTRPEDACPAGKKCLLVETEENGVIVPHWFPIIEAPEE